MVNDILLNVKAELQSYHRNRSEALYDAISNRLYNHTKQYEKELTDTINSLTDTEKERLLKDDI